LPQDKIKDPLLRLAAKERIFYI